MAIYPDKKNGQLTGRFRVELQSGRNRYRQRHNSFAEAQKDEKRVQDLIAAGLPFTDSVAAPEASQVVHTLGSLLTAAQGVLWAGEGQEMTNWSHLRTITTILGPTTRLDTISTATLDKLAKALKDPKVIRPLVKRIGPEGMAPGSINRYLVHFRAALTFARKRGLTTLSVDHEDLEWPWQKEGEGRIRWIELDEEARILAWFRENDAEDMADLVYVAIRTGCRRTELLSAKLDQINGNRLHLWKTKNGKPRTVPMAPETLEKLTRLLTPGSAVQMPKGDRLRRLWDRMVVAMGLENDDDFVFHCCRHTCATRMIEANVNTAVIKEWMGHRRIETTLRYAHVRTTNLDSALEAVGELDRKAA